MRVKKGAPSGPTVPPASVPRSRRFDNKRNANLMFKSSDKHSLNEHVSAPKKRRARSVPTEGDKNFNPICNKNQNLKNASNQGAAQQDGDTEPQSHTSESVDSGDSGDEVGLDQPPQTEQLTNLESLHVKLGDCAMKIDQISYVLEKGIGSLTSLDKSLKDEQEANASLRKELKTLRRNNKHLRRRVDDTEIQISALKTVANKYYRMKETCSKLKTEWEDFKISTLTRDKQMQEDLQIRNAQISRLEHELDSLTRILRLEKEKASNASKLAGPSENHDQDFQHKLNDATEGFKASLENGQESSTRFLEKVGSQMG